MDRSVQSAFEKAEQKGDCLGTRDQSFAAGETEAYFEAFTPVLESTLSCCSFDGLGGACCSFPGIEIGCQGGSVTAGVCQINGGTFFESAVCIPDGTCVAP